MGRNNINEPVTLQRGEIKAISMVAIRCFKCGQAGQLTGLYHGCSYSKVAEQHGYQVDAKGRWFCNNCKTPVPVEPDLPMIGEKTKKKLVKVRRARTKGDTL